MTRKYQMDMRYWHYNPGGILGWGFLLKNRIEVYKDGAFDGTVLVYVHDRI